MYSYEALHTLAALPGPMFHSHFASVTSIWIALTILSRLRPAIEQGKMLVIQDHRGHFGCYLSYLVLF